ncbi:acyl-CoA thioesterase II [Aliiglaciecola sp. CAU 1673]|uniref:acyl-CoA thioesterase II n=1 Tax=Aliiglaciecola sp. CAU 1673 TaxID=3032595 RepID=UPI0023D9C7C0|nr:acyl-CoA thioesterase II [Aliiglaciecola sp. CAU 1673]MDF2177542.1 acyl-CoA thioesterase II [Aliiglaciecola sp. CAU 1673]
MKNIALTELLTLEPLEKGLFRGLSWDLGFRALFGGQVMGQALAAAQNTVEADRVAHSLHCYFLLPGDAHHPVVYDVEIIRDGRSFATRRVKAIQGGKTIFYMTASFQHAEQGLEHQYAPMPTVPKPESLSADIAFYENILDKLPANMVEKLAYHKPIDMRTVQAINPMAPQKSEPRRDVWMRASQPLGDDLKMHQSCLTYASDYYFLVTALQPHGMSLMEKGLRMATIDHAMWFHRPFNFDDWLLYSMESPFCGNARALVRGQIFNQKGELVASTMQEGMIRKFAE